MMIQEYGRDVLCFAAVHEDEPRRTELAKEKFVEDDATLQVDVI
jgi:hypothetical protein